MSHDSSATDQAMPVQVRLRRSILEAVEDWRRRQARIPSRTKAMQTLIERALEQEAASA
jgi:hypothetical protein